MDVPLGGVHKLRLQILAFFDHLPPSVYIFYGMEVYKKLIFLTTYPPPLVNIVCERPPMIIVFGVGFKCPRKIYLNTQCPPPLIRFLPSIIQFF